MYLKNIDIFKTIVYFVEIHLQDPSSWWRRNLWILQLEKKKRAHVFLVGKSIVFITRSDYSKCHFRVIAVLLKMFEILPIKKRRKITKKNRNY